MLCTGPQDPPWHKINYCWRRATITLLTISICTTVLIGFKGHTLLERSEGERQSSFIIVQVLIFLSASYHTLDISLLLWWVDHSFIFIYFGQSLTRRVERFPSTEICRSWGFGVISFDTTGIETQLYNLIIKFMRLIRTFPPQSHNRQEYYRWTDGSVRSSTAVDVLWICVSFGVLYLEAFWGRNSLDSTAQRNAQQQWKV